MFSIRKRHQLITAPEGLTGHYLLDVSTDYEERLLRNWLADEIGPAFVATRIDSSRRGKGGDDVGLAEVLTQDRFLIPARVVWMAPEKKGRRSVRLTDIFTAGDPRDPRGLRARWIYRARPGRVVFVTAEGAHVPDLARDHIESGHVDPLPSYVTWRAWRALDRVERRLQGNRYKIPRFVPEAILTRREFLSAVEDVAEQEGIEITKALSRSERYLREIAATNSPYVIDLIANGIRLLYRQGYGEIRYSPADISRIAAIGAEQPVAFLPSHRSNLDRLSLQYLLWENDLPPNHTAGGINMNFFPIGPLLRRTGVFFIRRSFRDNLLYKTVLRAYLDFLVEKRFPLEWYMEGGRSRSGRLMPPRLGLLNYVVDSVKRGKSEDLMLIPVSISYDQIQDVPDYAREAQGKEKEKESISWFFKAIRSLRRRYGDIHVRFGEPVSVASVSESIPEGAEDGLGLHKLAFEVMHRIAHSTPATPTSVVSVGLLSAGGAARTATDLAVTSVELTSLLSERGISMTEDVDLARPGNVAYVLEWLVENNYVSTHEALDRKVYWLDETQMVSISYYRNMIVHYFVPRALAEIALSSESVRTVDDVRQELLELRDLLKFEFFFPEKEQFLEETAADISLSAPDWENLLEASGPDAVLAKLKPRVAGWALVPFLDAYQVVGDELEALQSPFDQKQFLKLCLARARMYRIEGKLISGESASQVLFKSALALAKNRDLLDLSDDVPSRRAAFAEQVRRARRLAAENR